MSNPRIFDPGVGTDETWVNVYVFILFGWHFTNLSIWVYIDIRMAMFINLSYWVYHMNYPSISVSPHFKRISSSTERQTDACKRQYSSGFQGWRVKKHAMDIYTWCVCLQSTLQGFTINVVFHVALKAFRLSKWQSQLILYKPKPSDARAHKVIIMF